MDYTVVPIHQHLEYLPSCCQLINAEWHRSDTARLHSLSSSCDTLPTSLILLQNKTLLGHAKLSIIPSMKNEACFVESVVIDKDYRGKGLGTILMNECEKYCRTILNLKCIYLSTRGQECFYKKLGYQECAPVSIYGSFLSTSKECDTTYQNQKKMRHLSETTTGPAPPPPPMPNNSINKKLTSKTFMKKQL